MIKTDEQKLHMIIKTAIQKHLPLPFKIVFELMNVQVPNKDFNKTLYS